MIEAFDTDGCGRRRRAVGPRAVLVTALLTTPGLCFAQLTVNPYVSAQVEHDSNVFRLQDRQTALLLTGDSTLGDTDERYIVGTDGTYQWGRESLVGKFEGRKVEYDHFTANDHSEYLADLALNWKVLSELDGVLSLRQEKLAAPFENRDSSTLEVNTDRSIFGKVNYTFTPDWRLDGSVNFHTLKAPLQFYPDFTEHETISHAGISYLGVANLTYGIAYDHVDGSYTHAVGVGAYSENTSQFVVNYKISGLSSFNGSLGYTSRTQTEPDGSVSGLTGSLGYVRQLTGKTSVHVQVSRVVNSYLAAGGSEIDTAATVGAVWAATYRLSVSADYGYVRSTFVGEAIPGSTANGRVDKTPTGAVNVNYDLLRQLRLKAYYNRTSRDSNFDLYSYNDTTIGIQLTAHWR